MPLVDTQRVESVRLSYMIYTRLTVRLELRGRCNTLGLLCCTAIGTLEGWQKESENFCERVATAANLGTKISSHVNIPAKLGKCTNHTRKSKHTGILYAHYKSSGQIVVNNR